MQQRTPKKWRMLRLIGTYVVMVTAIAIIVTVTVLLTLGYRLDRDGHIAQGGLVQFATTPSGASVQIDGVTTGLTTSDQKTLAAGNHSFTYSKKGYREWNRSLNLTAGSILWLNYARLVPEQLSPKTVATFDSVADAKASPDHTKIGVIPRANAAQLTVENIKNDTIGATDFTLPNGTFTTPKNSKTQTFSIVSWSHDSRYLLLKHTYDSTTEWLRVDTSQLKKDNTDAVINITSILSINISQIVFRPTNASQLYAITSGDNDLRRINLADTTISAPLAQNVARYSVASDGMITYASRPDETTKKRTIGFISDNSTKNQVLRTYDETSQNALYVASGIYYDQRYVAVVDGTKLTIFAAELSDSASTGSTLSMKAVTTETLPFMPTDLSINTRGRFITATNAGRYAIYDNELSAYTESDFTASNQSSTTKGTTLDWLDNYLLYSDAGGSLQIQDFDGTNRQTIMDVTSSLDATLNPSGKYLYGFQADDSGKTTLVRVQMILD